MNTVLEGHAATRTDTSESSMAAATDRMTVVESTDVAATAALTVTRRVTITIDRSLDSDTTLVSRPTWLGSLVARIGMALIVWGSRTPVPASVLEARAAMDEQRRTLMAISRDNILR